MPSGLSGSAIILTTGDVKPKIRFVHQVDVTSARNDLWITTSNRRGITRLLVLPLNDLDLGREPLERRLGGSFLAYLHPSSSLQRVIN